MKLNLILDSNEFNFCQFFSYLLLRQSFLFVFENKISSRKKSRLALPLEKPYHLHLQSARIIGVGITRTVLEIYLGQTTYRKSLLPK